MNIRVISVRRYVVIWVTIVLLLSIGSLSVLPLSGNTKKGSGEVQVQQRLLFSPAVSFNNAFSGASTCQVSPNGDSMQCEVLAYAGDRGDIVITVINNANTPTVASISFSTDPNLQWGVSSSFVGGVREVGNGEFAVYIPANAPVSLDLAAQVSGTAPDGVYSFSFAVTPAI